jgi:hypothetical protein
MRILTRLSVVLAVLMLAAGPIVAAPLTPPLSPTLTSASTPAAGVACAVLALALGGLAIGMAIKVKDNATITKKFVTRAGAAAGDYKAGVEGAAGDWETGAKAGEGNYEQGVQEAIADKRYGRGITGSAGKYRDNASKLGAQRYVPGIQNAESAYGSGVAPYLEKLRSLTLPPKGPRRSPANQQRANMVALELGKLKTGK